MRSAEPSSAATMRLMVYRELLLFAKNTDMDEYHDWMLVGEGDEDSDLWAKFCHPSILRTCREIKKEGSPVLYDENVINCRFELNSPDPELGDLVMR